MFYVVDTPPTPPHPPGYKPKYLVTTYILSITGDNVLCPSLLEFPTLVCLPPPPLTYIFFSRDVPFVHLIN